MDCKGQMPTLDITYKYINIHSELVDCFAMDFITCILHMTFKIFCLGCFIYLPNYNTLASSSSNNTGFCDITPYPSLCWSTLPASFTGNVQDHCRFFLRQALSETQVFLGSDNSSKLRELHMLTNSTLLALQDCHLLEELNMEYLSQVLQFTNSNSTTPNSFEIYESYSMLSATLTNQDTCLTSLHEATHHPGITSTGLWRSLSDGIDLYGISLSFFKQGWVDAMTRTERRKLLQSSIDSVIVSKKVIVNPDGSGDFTTIRDAVTAAPNKTGTEKGYFVIYVVAGVYNEYVTINRSKQNLMMVGEGINKTVITGNRSVGDGWTTFDSATFIVLAKGFVSVNITFRNTAGASMHQAVAVRNGADMSVFYSCSFEGYQDTLYVHSMRQFYRNCDIYGTVDFVFGNAATVFQNCNMYPRLPMPGQFNAITAQSRLDPNQNTGISIHHCTMEAAGDLAGSNKDTRTYLGRPWRIYSRTVYMQSLMSEVIDPKGWVEMSGGVESSTVYYAEYANEGPGSDTRQRVTWPGYHVIDASAATQFSVSNFIQGYSWLPKTGVPFTGDLL